jgi:hypothetical protein
MKEKRLNFEFIGHKFHHSTMQKTIYTHTTGQFFQNLTELPPALAGGLKGARTIWALAQVFCIIFGLKPRF